MKLQMAIAAADDDKLQTIAAALFADEASYLLEDAVPVMAADLADLSGKRGIFEDEVIIAGIRRVLSTQVIDGSLRLELADAEKYGEGAECELFETIKALKPMPGARFVYVRGEEIARGERFPPFAEVRTDEGIIRARVDGDDATGWEVVLPREATEEQRWAANKVGAVLERDGWLFADAPAAAAKP